MGAETQRPLATVVDGIITSTLLTLLLLPLIYEWSESRAEAKQRARMDTEDINVYPLQSSVDTPLSKPRIMWAAVASPT